MVGSFGAMWVQLSQYECLFPLHLTIPRPSVYSIFTLNLATSTQLYCFGMFNFSLSWPMQCIPFLSSFMRPLAFPTIRPSHHCLGGSSACTGCAVFHLSTCSIRTAISSAHTHDCFSQSFHLTEYIHCPSIYYQPATASTSDSSHSSDSSSYVVLGELIA
jgi:hypothetical protein